MGNDTICFGKSTQITAVATGGSGNFNFIWIGIGSGATQNVSPISDSTFTVIANDGNGCSDTSKITIIVNGPVIPLITGTDTLICSGDYISISASATGGTGNYNYTWLNPPLGNGPGPFLVSPASTTNYIVQVSDSCGIATGSLNIMVNNTPSTSPIWLPDSGCVPLTVQFSASTTGNPPGTTYTWIFGDGDSAFFPFVSHTYTIPGSYVPSVTVNNGACDSTFYSSFSVINVFPKPVAAFSATPQPTTLAFPEITFTNNSSGANGFFWEFGDGYSLTGAGSPVYHSFKDTGIFTTTLIVKNEFNCWDTFALNIEIKPEFEFWIPNAFTPDDKNGKNDFFSGKGICFDKYEMYIFDRWGDEIYHTIEYDKPWDGHAHGGKKPVQIGVYIYLIYVWDCLGEKHSYFGHVTVVR